MTEREQQVFNQLLLKAAIRSAKELTKEIQQ